MCEALWNFIAVFTGATFGAVLTVWLTHRAQSQREVQEAFRRLRQVLYDLREGEPHDGKDWDRASGALSSELSHIDYHARWPVPKRKEILAANDDLASALTWSDTGDSDWDRTADALAQMNKLVFPKRPAEDSEPQVSPEGIQTEE
jgi:hypothetical protein